MISGGGDGDEQFGQFANSGGDFRSFLEDDFDRSEGVMPAERPGQIERGVVDRSTIMLRFLYQDYHREVGDEAAFIIPVEQVGYLLYDTAHPVCAFFRERDTVPSRDQFESGKTAFGDIRKVFQRFTQIFVTGPPYHPGEDAGELSFRAVGAAYRRGEEDFQWGAFYHDTKRYRIMGAITREAAKERHAHESVLQDQCIMHRVAMQNAASSGDLRAALPLPWTAEQRHRFCDEDAELTCKNFS